MKQFKYNMKVNQQLIPQSFFLCEKHIWKSSSFQHEVKFLFIKLNKNLVQQLPQKVDKKQSDQLVKINMYKNMHVYMNFSPEILE